MKKTELQGYKKIIIKFLSAFMVLFPWITYIHIVQYSDAEKAVYSGNNGITIDFFIYSKEVVLIVVAVLAVLCFIGERFLLEKADNNIPLIKGKNKWLFRLIGIFGLGAVVSTLFSEYQKNALWGSHEIGEGLWTLLAYVILILLFYNYFANEYAFAVMKRAIAILSGITAVLSFVEWFYKPLLEIEVIQKLVAPVQYSSIVSSMKADRFTDAISLTFYNPGYFGGFVCLLVPFMLAFFLQTKQIKQKVTYGILFIGLLFGVIASGSTTALYVAIFEVVVVVLIYILFSQDKKNTSVQGGIALLITSVTLVFWGGVTGNYVISIASNENSITEDFWFGMFEVKDIQLEGNSVQLVGAEKTLGIFYENGRFVFRNENGKVLESVRTENGVTFTEEGYECIKVSAVDVSQQVEGAVRCVIVEAGYLDAIEFFLLEDGTFSGIGQGGTIVKDIGDAGTPDVLKQYYGILTGRGYAWANTLPILKETLLLGKGPGNFAFYFKHFDYVGMLATHKTVKQVITKPHNAYLQYATELGLPAAIAFFGIFVGAVIKAAKVFWKNKNQKETMESDAVHIAAIVSIFGFFIYSIINDSMVTVTPIICMITGVLLASSYMKENKR